MVKNCVRFFVLIASLFVSIVVHAQDVLGPKFKLLPVPKKIELLKGAGITYNTLSSLKLEGSAKKPVLDKSIGNLTQASSQGRGSLVMKIDSLEMSASVGSSRVDLQACKLEYSIVSPK